jgi:hypothetical protein
MDLITDGLLLAAASFAGTYCYVLARRVRALKDLDSGIGAAIMRMTHALEEARRALDEAKSASQRGNRDMRDLAARAEAACGQLRMLLAATRDLPPAPAPEPAPLRRVEADRQRRDDLAPPEHGDRRALLESRVPLPLRAPSDPVWRRVSSAREWAVPAGRTRVRSTDREDELLAALAELAAPRRR